MLVVTVTWRVLDLAIEQDEDAFEHLLDVDARRALWTSR